jgi:hypothetical protein
MQKTSDNQDRFGGATMNLKHCDSCKKRPVRFEVIQGKKKPGLWHGLASLFFGDVKWQCPLCGHVQNPSYGADTP